MLPTIFIVFAVSVGAYAAALKVFPMFGLLDFPERYGLSRPRLPYPTGIIAVLIFIGFALVMLPHGLKENGMLIGVAVLGIVSFIDDRKPLPSWLRLLVQILVAFLIFAAGSRIYTLTNPLGGILKLDEWTAIVPGFGTLPVLSGLFTIVWLLLTINALNWFDGIPGQVSVIATIGFLMLGCLALFRNNEPEIALIAFSLAGIALAGGLFDFPPGKMLMGDTGSMFFGLMLGLLSVYHGGKVATAFLALGIPLIDALFVVLRRVSEGRSPFSGGRDHLHHRLLARGFFPRQIVAFTAILGALFGATALFLNTAEKAIAGVILLVIVGALNFYLGPKR